MQGDPLTWRPILLAPEETPAPVRERIARDREVVRKRFSALVTAGLTMRGAPDLDAEVASHALIAIAEHFGRLLLTEPDLFDADRLANTAAQVLALLSERR